MNKREEVIEEVKRDSFLSRMYRLDQKRVEDIIDYVLGCNDPVEALIYRDVASQMASEFIRVPANVEAFLAFVDRLLPKMPEEEGYEAIADDGRVLWVE